MANAPSLIHRHLFGLKGDTIDNIHYINDTIILYPCGHNIIIYNIENKTQRFIHGSIDGSLISSSISCITLSSNRRYVAVAEKGERPFITIYDVHTLKKRKVLTSTDLNATEYINIKFSPDSKTLLTLSNGPDYCITNWLWEKIKTQQVIKLGVSNTSNLTSSSTNNVSIRPNMISFCPSDPTVICVSGYNILTFYRVEPSGFKAIQCRLNEYKSSDNFTAHVWLEERTIVSTNTGDILILEQAVLRNVVSNPCDGIPIHSLAVHSNGVIVGCEDSRVFLLEKTDISANSMGRTYYSRSKSLKIENSSGIVKNIALSPNEENLMVTTDTNQILALSLTNSDILKAEEMKFEVVMQNFHHGAITGLDICMRKPLLVTCGSDHTVRIWNYLDKTLEICQSFPEEPFSVAFHPSGLHIIVGFNDKLRMMNLLVDSLKTYKELPVKACKEVSFSNGGQSFAAANMHAISVYNFFTAENTQNLRAHSQRIRSLYWTNDDASIISSGSDGAVFEWKLKDGSRPQEYVQKGIQFTSTLATLDNHLYVVGSDRMLKEITDSNANKEMESGTVLTQIAISHPPQRMFFAGTENGLLRSFSFPLTGDWQDYPCHSASVTRIRVSFNDSWLFTASEDGSLAILEIREKESRLAKRKPDVIVPWSEEVLVTKSDLEEKSQYLVELQSKVDELTLQNEYQLRLEDLNYTDKIKETTDRFQNELLDHKNAYDRLREQKSELENEYDEKVKKWEEDHSSRIAEYEAFHNRTLTEEMERYRDLERKLKIEQDSWDAKFQALEEEHLKEMDYITDEFENKLEDKRAERELLEEQKELKNKELKETSGQMEEDADLEIEELKEKYEAKLKWQREATLRLKGENGIMKKKFSQLKKDIDDQKEELKIMADKQTQLNAHIKDLNKEIESYRTEIAGRDDAIGDKEKRIYELKKRNQELEKWKFVLDYRIKDLKKQIEPREKDIENMRKEIKNKDLDLEAFHQESSQIQNATLELQQNLTSMQDVIDKRRAHYRNVESKLLRFYAAVQEAMQFIQNPTELVARVESLYSEFVSNEIRSKLKSSEVDSVVNDEYARQKVFLERSVNELRNKLVSDTDTHQVENMRIMQENVSLVKEINDLRKEMKTIRQKQTDRDSATNTKKGVVTELEAQMEIRRQMERIRELTEAIESLRPQSRVSRPMSREQLPPIH